MTSDLKKREEGAEQKSIGKIMAAKERIIARNKKALHSYDVIEKYEAGIQLTGTEVKSLRDNSCQLRDCYISIRKGEAWLVNVHIAPYRHGGWDNVDPERTRKLLLHKQQIRLLDQKIKRQGYTLIPLSIYFNKDSRVKLEIALAKGKKLHDKRQAIAEKDAKRTIERALKEQNRKHY